MVTVGKNTTSGISQGRYKEIKHGVCSGNLTGQEEIIAQFIFLSNI